MKVIFKQVPSPMFTNFTVFAKLDVNKIEKEKTVRISPRLITKTQINTAIQVGEFRASMNWDINGFNTKRKEEYNYLNNESTVHYYFKLLKSQTEEDYDRYLEACIKKFISNLKLDLDEIIVELEPIKK